MRGVGVEPMVNYSDYSDSHRHSRLSRLSSFTFTLYHIWLHLSRGFSFLISTFSCEKCRGQRGHAPFRKCITLPMTLDTIAVTIGQAACAFLCLHLHYTTNLWGCQGVFWRFQKIFSIAELHRSYTIDGVQPFLPSQGRSLDESLSPLDIYNYSTGDSKSQ